MHPFRLIKRNLNKRRSPDNTVIIESPFYTYKRTYDVYLFNVFAHHLNIKWKPSAPLSGTRFAQTISAFLMRPLNTQRRISGRFPMEAGF